MNESLLLLKLITPIWTGDIDLKSDFIRSTGIIGSLRLWTEVILRGMDYYICDPTSDNRCPEKINNDLAYCPACLIFGATGIRRLFRMEINGIDIKKVFEGEVINIRPSGRNRGWYLGNGLIGNAALRVTTLDREGDDILLILPLSIAAKWGAIGAKTQHGYGVVSLVNEQQLNIETFINSLEKILGEERLKRLNIEKKRRSTDNNTLPNLREMFFAKVQFSVNEANWWEEIDGIKQALEPKNKKGEIDQKLKEKNYQILKAWYNSGSVPIAPAIKNWLRYGDGRTLWQTQNNIINHHIENWLFGTARDKKSVSKINISCAYLKNDNQWEFRIWGWIPSQENPSGFNKQSFLENLKNSLNGKGSINIPWTNLLGNHIGEHKLLDWHEYNSPKDTKTPNESNLKKFLQSLLEG
ncbi:MULTISPECIES: type III-B CRISPR module RAMP protein Cmr1 [Thermodesulfovibrio]|nr:MULTISPECIES: type III-B CRISPR module RAMP protein Cmr1 [Thermodesulfovibrio]MDI6864143.1 type III-B CRISPR module RAMP protein Cmr1 [Thermodesulfovibrio yellowstonii]